MKSVEFEKTILALTNYCIDLENRLDAITKESSDMSGKMLEYYDEEKEEFLDSELKGVFLREIDSSFVNIERACWYGNKSVGDSIYRKGIENKDGN